MRTLKFRAFLKSNRKMYDVLVLDIIDRRALIENTEDKERPLRGYVKMSEIELMQYTGIADRNGREIYEGDFVRNVSKEKTYRVVWNGSHSAFKLKDLKNEYKSMFFANQSFGRYEVIGNIYENPELLKWEWYK